MQLYNLVNEKDAVIASNINFGVKLNEILTLENEYIGPITGNYSADNLIPGEKIFIHGHGSDGMFTCNDTVVSGKEDMDNIFYADYAVEIANKLKGRSKNLLGKVFDIQITSCKAASRMHKDEKEVNADSLVHNLAKELASHQAAGTIKGVTANGLSYPPQAVTFTELNSAGVLLGKLNAVKNEVNQHFANDDSASILDVMKFVKTKKYQDIFDEVFRLNSQNPEFGNSDTHKDLYVIETISGFSINQ